MTSLRIFVTGSQVCYLVNLHGDLMQVMKACGHVVSAIAAAFDADTRFELVAIGFKPVDVSLARTEMNPFGDLRDMIGLHAQMCRLNPDAILAIAIKPAIHGILAPQWRAYLGGSRLLRRWGMPSPRASRLVTGYPRRRCADFTVSPYARPKRFCAVPRRCR